VTGIPALLIALRRRKPIWLGLLFASILITAAIVLSRPARYRATTTIELPPPMPIAASRPAETGMETLDFGRYWRTELEILRLASTARIVLQRVSEAARSRGEPSPFEGMSDGERTSWFARSVRIEPRPSTWLFEVHVTDERPAQLAEVANELARFHSARAPASRIHQVASPPEAPLPRRTALCLAFAGTAGLLLGIWIASVVDRLDDRIHDQADIEALRIGIPILGSVRRISTSDAEALAVESDGRRVLAASRPTSPFARDILGIRTALAFGDGPYDDRAFLITSTRRREGRALIALNLAAVLANSGLRTLLIDADLRKPSLHRALGLSNKTGLTNAIIGQLTAQECIRSPRLEGLVDLEVLSSGPNPPNPSELLGRPQLNEVLRCLGGEYDRILVVSAPIGAATDAAVLGHVVDRTILVVRAGETSRRHLERSLWRLYPAHRTAVGIVLNDTRFAPPQMNPSHFLLRDRTADDPLRRCRVRPRSHRGS
jgi:capsular exopolysaccharide synthesis family protein